MSKAACEGQWIVRCVGKDSSGGWRDRLDTGVREANAEIQSGGCFGCFDRPDDIDRVVIQLVVGFFKIRPTFDTSHVILCQEIPKRRKYVPADGTGAI